VADWAGSDYRTIQDYYNRMNRKKAGSERSGPAVDRILTGQLSNDVRVERDALGILLQNPWLIDEYYSWLDEDHFHQASSRQLIKAMEAMYEEGKGYDPDLGADAFAHELIEHLENKESRNLAISLLFQEEVGVETDEEKLQLQLRDLFSGLKDFYLERQIRDLKTELGNLTTRAHRDHELEVGISREIFDLEKQRQDRKKDK
jgi:replicative DNA helicase